MNEIKTVKDVRGEQLSYVCFVMDYIQFGFNGAILTVYSKPIIEIGVSKNKFPELGSRDALCSFIGHAVQDVSVEEGKRIVLTFYPGRIEIPLDINSRVLGDAAEFMSGRDQAILDY